MYEELSVHRTPLGELLLRRRRTPGLPGVDIYEVKLADDLLMSSLLTESERKLADLTLPAVKGAGFPVLVGGLGLGYTAAAALAHEAVGSVTVVELLPEVIAWHEQGLVPLGPELIADPRCTLRQGDFFRLLAAPESHLKAGYGAILVDIDHAPESWLHPDHADFYGAAGIGAAAARLAPGGAFGFWSAGREDEGFTALLGSVFGSVSATEIEVLNPLVDEMQVDTVYVAKA